MQLYQHNIWVWYKLAQDYAWLKSMIFKKAESSKQAKFMGS